MIHTADTHYLGISFLLQNQRDLRTLAVTRCFFKFSENYSLRFVSSFKIREDFGPFSVTFFETFGISKTFSEQVISRFIWTKKKKRISVVLEFQIGMASTGHSRELQTLYLIGCGAFPLAILMNSKILSDRFHWFSSSNSLSAFKTLAFDGAQYRRLRVLVWDFWFASLWVMFIEQLKSGAFKKVLEEFFRKPKNFNIVLLFIVSSWNF